MTTTRLVFATLGALATGAAGCGGGDSGGPDSAPGADARSTADAAPQRALAIAGVDDLGRLPLPSAGVSGRDGGTGGAFGGRYLWTFGDTFVSTPNAIDGTHLLSATSGWTAIDDPLALVEPVGKDGNPAQLIPYTAAEIDANTEDAFNGWALWPGNVLDTGDDEALVVFHRIKRTDGTGFASQGIGTARIALDATVATRTEGDLFSLPARLYTPSQVIDDHVIAFACENVGFLNFGCRMARAPKAEAEDPAAYEYWDGDTWQDDEASSVIVLDHAGNAPSISYNAHLGRWLAVNGDVVSSTVRLRTAPDYTGPWGEDVLLEASDAGYLAPTAEDAFNYIMLEHPALSASDGSSIVISYSRPTAAFQGDVRVARITLE